MGYREAVFMGKEQLLTVMLLMVHIQCSNSGAVQFTSENFDKTIASTELVFVNFYADWCRFSNMLAPVWDSAADLATSRFDGGRVVMGKVDCDQQDGIASRFHISKYPTLKLLRNGHPAKSEYRGQRSAEALVRFLEDELRDPVRVINATSDLREEKKGQVIGYFESRASTNYQSFQRMATALKDECHMIAGFGEAFRHLLPSGRDTVVVRKAGSSEEVSLPNLDIMNTQKLTDWAQRTCVPLVREITFGNAEELTEERLPFMILFHHPDDKETPQQFVRVVEQQLFSEKNGINFLTADGLQFAHPLHHLGKTKEDLPLIAIDSFRHMYVFPDIKEMESPGRLKQFIDDLHSGKLHREFHYGPQPVPAAAAGTQPTTRPPTSPPESVFKKLGPSESRYSLLKDEL
ncbi:endoplasmic reticulum resident protein 44-like [Pollicipes pollicipes]|uniref:endoplasmic reticulum resident protein 44-like n=1 Tax=Pollicipes pollicipes TaxID=41117 RepID=UPI001884B323|nr:endoplasmic reticulum resident protein 44-like [Pollicipes pollicipes]